MGMSGLLELHLSNLWPAVMLAVGFPLVMLVLNESISACERRSLAVARTLRTTRNLVAPSLAVLVFARYVLELPTVSTTMRLIQSAFLVFLLYAALGVVNDLFFGGGREDSWRARVPKLFADLSRAIVVALGALVIYSHVWGREVQGALTALGVGSVVIGLALQEPLGNIVSGLMLLFERPLKVGYWVNAEGVTGKVIEINWRSVHIQTSTRELRIVPNVRIYKGAFSNLSRPTDVRTEVIQIGFSYDDPPNRVKEVIGALLRKTPGVLSDPAPAIRTVEYGDFSVIYKVIFSVARQEELASTRDALMTRLWYVARREGLSIPFPITMEYSPGENPGAPKASPQELLRDHPRFKPALKDASVGQPSVVEFAKDEVVQGKNRHFDGFGLILQGRAALRIVDRHGHYTGVGEIGVGECFGDATVSGTSAEEFSIVALEDLKVMLFDSKTMNDLLNNSPSLAAEIGEAIESRRQATLSASSRHLRDKKRLF
jgi:small-conductance mechanosensitive channel